MRREDRREFHEYVGLDREPGRLLLVDWSPPSPARPLPLVEFVFDGGTVDPADIRLGDDELDEFRLLPPHRAMPLLSDHGRRRLAAALEARRDGTMLYRSVAEIEGRHP